MSNTDLWRFAALHSRVNTALRAYMAQQRSPASKSARDALAESMLSLAEIAHECEHPVTPPTADPAGFDLGDYDETNVIPIRGLMQ